MLSHTYITTPIGILIARADEQALHSLQFFDETPPHTTAQHQETFSPVLEQITRELELYFAGKLTQFTTPISLHGTQFQLAVWDALKTITYGTTQSYTDIATQIGNKKAVRAVGTANGANKFVIIIPCHRVITHLGKLGGYSAGIERKIALLNFEKQFMQK